MSVEDENAMSVGHVQKLNVNGLCQWLKGKLNDDILEIAQTTISTNWISGEVFLHYTRDNWIGYGMKGGVADSLVILAGKVKESGTKEVPLDYDAVEVHGERRKFSEVMKVLRRVVGQSDVLPGKAFEGEFENGSGECHGFWQEINREQLTAEQIEIIDELMVVYGRMMVNGTFCLGTNFVEYKKRASEMLTDACLGFLCIDFPLVRCSKFFHEKSPLHYNKNWEWTPPHFFQKGEGSNVYYMWKPKCDGALSCCPHNQENFEFLLVLSEHSRDENDKDIDKITALMTASAQTIQLCVSGQELASPIYLCCFSFQRLKLHLHVMEVKIDTATFYRSRRIFDCSKKEGYHQAMKCSWRIAKYASDLADKIHSWSVGFKPSRDFRKFMDERQARTRPSGSNAPSSSHHSASGRSKSPKTSGSKRQREGGVTEGIDHVVRLEEVIDLLLNTGEFFDVEPMFAIGFEYSSHIEMNPHVDRILTATHGKNREAVVVKKVSPSEFNYVKKLKEKVLSLTKSPQIIGFLFPESFKDFGDSMKFLVFKKVRPLSSLCFDDLGLVEKIYDQLFKFLKFCQAHQIVHGDLKLSNLGLDEGNNLCVFDWEERVDGTEGYMAPEVASRSTKPNALSDIYSAGILLLEIVDKIGHSEEIVQVRLQRLRLAISNMLAKGPEKRKLVDLESIKLTRSDTWSSSKESGLSGSVILEKRPRMVDRSHANDDGYKMITT